MTATAAEETEALPKPKVFISYSWSSPAHRKLVKDWADRLISEAVDVIIDIYHLKPGHDKYVFMERMVNDPSVTHVLVISDRAYAEKGNARRAGVGVESTIISKEVYEKADQEKFVPIVCEYDEQRNPYLPTFLQSRIWFDFSTPEAVNQNWEQVVRHLYGKPLHQKPALGKPPAYVLTASDAPTVPFLGRLAVLTEAIKQQRPGLTLYRQDFLDAWFDFVDALRIRRQPEVAGKFGGSVLETCNKLKPARDAFVDWILTEGAYAPSKDFDETLLQALERLIEMKARPPELNSWNEIWFEGHRVFVYETFLYVVAALLRSKAYEALHEVFTSHYMLPETERHGSQFDVFDVFWTYSETLQILAPEGRKLNAPAAELIKRQADRSDLPLASVIEAELLTHLMALITPNARWYPQTMYYSNSQTAGFPFFARLPQRKHFAKLATITGIADVDELATRMKDGHDRMDIGRWHNFFDPSFSSILSIEKWDKLK